MSPRPPPLLVGGSFFSCRNILSGLVPLFVLPATSQVAPLLVSIWQDFVLLIKSSAKILARRLKNHRATMHRKQKTPVRPATPKTRTEEERAMVGWDIFREMESLRREMDEMFRGFGLGRRLNPPSCHPPPGPQLSAHQPARGQGPLLRRHADPRHRSAGARHDRPQGHPDHLRRAQG